MRNVRRDRGVVILAGELAVDAREWLERYGAVLQQIGGLWLIELAGGMTVEEGSGDYRGVFAISFEEDDQRYVRVELDIDAWRTRVTLRS